MKPVFLIIVFILIYLLHSCCNNNGDYYPYLAGTKILNEQKDSINYSRIYFYENDSNFSNPKDSSSITFQQVGKDIESIFSSKNELYKKQFKYVLFYKAKIVEYKIKIIEDGCQNCGDCDEEIFPKIIEVNGLRKSNNKNSITLN
jgi:hypothetical protein